MELTDEELNAIILNADRVAYEAYLHTVAITGAYPIPRKFKHWVYKTLKDMMRTPTMRTTVKVGKRVAIALVAALLAAAMTIMTVGAAREWFMSLLREIFPGDHAIVEVIPNEDVPEFMVYTLGYVPDGYEQTSRRVREVSRLVDLKYARADNPEQTISIKQLGKGVAKYDHSGDEVGTVNINGDEATYSRKGDRKTLSWTDGTYNFLMHITDPNVDKKEAILIAESLVPDLATDK